MLPDVGVTRVEANDGSNKDFILHGAEERVKVEDELHALLVRQPFCSQPRLERRQVQVVLRDVSGTSSVSCDKSWTMMICLQGEQRLLVLFEALRVVLWTHLQLALHPQLFLSRVTLSYNVKPFRFRTYFELWLRPRK